HPLFKNVPKQTQVWASHGDTVTKLPKDFKAIATSGGAAAMASKNNRVLAIQFHPEVAHTKEGKKILQNFLDIAGCEKDWNPSDLIKQIQKEVLEATSPQTSPERRRSNQKVILGFSGGVDSTTLA